MTSRQDESSFLAPRRILAINPNTNPTVTRRIRKILQLVTPPGVEIEVESPPTGPDAVETEEEKVWATRQVLNLISNRTDHGYDGYIMACFDDIAVAEALALTGVPVFYCGPHCQDH
jgi:allantoin racemase